MTSKVTILAKSIPIPGLPNVNFNWGIILASLVLTTIGIMAWKHTVGKIVIIGGICLLLGATVGPAFFHGLFHGGTNNTPLPVTTK